MAELSTEAKVMIGAFWSIMSTCELAFERPHIITDQARKGLDDLVEAGFLTLEEGRHGARWTPTPKMKTDKPRVSQAFVKANTFALTDETRAEK